MAYCKNCGKEIDDKAYVCPYCGVKCSSENDQPAKTAPMAIAALVMGILSLASFYGGILFSILALVFAKNASKSIYESGGRLEGAGMAKAGKILGIIGLAIWCGLILLIFITSCAITMSTI